MKVGVSFCIKSYWRKGVVCISTNKKQQCHRCKANVIEERLWMGRNWCPDCFQKQTGLSANSAGLDICSLCGEELFKTNQHILQEGAVCLQCLLRLGPDRAQTLVKVKKLDPVEVSAAVNFLRTLLTRNQTLRLREAISQGGRNWWVRLPEFGEFICRVLVEQGTAWDNEVLDEVWDRLIEEAVEE